MKKLFLLLLITTFCFSQEKELTVSQIDSIAKTSKNKIQSSGVIEKNKKTIGGFNSTEIFSNDKLVYSTYEENYNDKKRKLNYFFEFYFFNDNPVLINIYIIKTDIKTKIEEKFETNLNENKIHSFKEIENPFSIKLRNKLNSLLIDYLNNKNTK
ncbi:hypothetical protein [Flavobacterium sp.]|uniref:hypothetical protein n=1 Tax=Flavobacterium sp. TaxID=239 RepID=UPI0025BFBB84|nr:hypothetical protein [Flavobacterium sp.]